MLFPYYLGQQCITRYGFEKFSRPGFSIEREWLVSAVITTISRSSIDPKNNFRHCSVSRFPFYLQTINHFKLINDFQYIIHFRIQFHYQQYLKIFYDKYYDKGIINFLHDKVMNNNKNKLNIYLKLIQLIFYLSCYLH